MKSLIGREWRDSSDGKVIEVYNPATNELIDTVPSLTKEESKRLMYGDNNNGEYKKKSSIAQFRMQG